MNMQIHALENIDKQQLTFDVNQQQLKKQSDQARRFSNPTIKDHPQLDNIKGALQILQPKQLISVLENTRDAINGQGEAVKVNQQDMPILAKPSETSHESDTILPASARLLELLGKINQLTADNSLQNQLIQLKSYNAKMEGTENSFSELATSLESQGEIWANDSDSLKSAKAESSQLESEVKSAESNLKSAQTTLAQLEAQAQEEDPVSPALSQKIDEAKQSVIAAQAAADKASQAYNQHTSNVLNPAIKAESLSRQALDITLAQSRSVLGATSAQERLVIENQRKQNDHQAKSLTFLMALMSQLIDLSASSDLKAAAELKTKLSEAATKDSEKKAQEYDENVRKSEEMQKVMGCVGKILGWVITAVSFAAAIFTGGASLAFAAIGLALAIGDEISQAVTGVSFIAQAMKPLMESVIQPMMQFIGSIYTKILESFGVDQSTAKMLGQIMGAIATAVLMVAAVAVAGSAVSKFAGVIVKKIGTKVMDKALDNIAGDILKRIGQGIGRSMGMQENKIAQIATRAEMATSAATFANTSIHTAGNIVNADMKIEAAKLKAQLHNNTALQELLSEMLERAVNDLKTKIETTNLIVQNISSIMENQMQAGKYLNNKLSTVAG